MLLSLLINDTYTYIFRSLEQSTVNINCKDTFLMRWWYGKYMFTKYDKRIIRTTTALQLIIF